METKLKLRILAKDILENSYLKQDSCPITRALARAGRPDLQDWGLHFQNKEEKIFKVSGGFSVMKRKIFGMYATKGDYANYDGKLPIKNFTATVIIHE